MWNKTCFKWTYPKDASYETTCVSEIQNIKDMENVIIASEQGKYQF